MLNYPQAIKPIYANQPSWGREKDFATARGVWIQLHLPIEKWIVRAEENKIQSSGGLLAQEQLQHVFVEPRLDVIEELLANIQMLSQAFKVLGVDWKSNVISTELDPLKVRLEKFRTIILKEIKNEPLTENDLKFISKFTAKYKVDNRRKENKLRIIFKPTDEIGATVIEDLLPTKILILVERIKNDNKFIFMGPIFNPREY